MSVNVKIPVAVLVLNYNGEAVLQPCLASWKRSNPAPQDIMVVDNASVDGSAERGNAAYPELNWQFLDKNLGYAAGNNRGIEKILEQFPDIEAVFLCNNDTVVSEKMLGLLWDAMKKNNTWAAVGPRIHMQANTKIWYEGASISTLWGRSYHWRWGHDAGDAGDNFELPRWGFVTGCGLLLRVQALRQLGMLDESLWAYCEDSDWCLRAWEADWRCGVVPHAQMDHAVSSSFLRVKDTAAYLSTRNSLELIRRHRVGIFPWAWMLCLGLDLAVVVFWRALKAMWQGEFCVVRAMLLGVLDFVRRRFGPLAPGRL